MRLRKELPEKTLRARRDQQAGCWGALTPVSTGEYGTKRDIYLVLQAPWHHIVGAESPGHTAAAQPQRHGAELPYTKKCKTGGEVFFKVNIPGSRAHEQEADANTTPALPIIRDAGCGWY